MLCLVASHAGWECLGAGRRLDSVGDLDLVEAHQDVDSAILLGILLSEAGAAVGDAVNVGADRVADVGGKAPGAQLDILDATTDLVEEGDRILLAEDVCVGHHHGPLAVVGLLGAAVLRKGLE